MGWDQALICGMERDQALISWNDMKPSFDFIGWDGIS
jgi:hypothetical protein